MRNLLSWLGRLLAEIVCKSEGFAKPGSLNTMELIRDPYVAQVGIRQSREERVEAS